MAFDTKKKLLCGVSIAALALSILASGPARANGGAGGSSEESGIAGAGGVTSTTVSPDGGAGVGPFSGGGGGGVSLATGIGGNGGSGDDGIGGSGGNPAESVTQFADSGITVTGGSGASGMESGLGGGGGGGGGFGIVITGNGDDTNGDEISGGAGGAGGAGIALGVPGGGGGGGGGVLLTGGGTFSNSASLSGGAGGAAGIMMEEGFPGSVGAGGGDGGSGLADTGGGSVTNSGLITGGAAGAGSSGSNKFDLTSGSGGNGGEGVLLTAGGDVDNTGSITGGAGGAAGSVAGCNNCISGSNGAGGAGIAAEGGATIMNAGSISGGLAGDGTTQADAVDLSGGGNTLILEPGYSLTGNVISTSGATNGGDTLALDGAGDSTFNISDIAASQPDSYSGSSQFFGFTNYEKTGSGSWTLTGSTGAVTPWTISAGTLSIAADDNLGADTGSIAFSGGTLQLTSGFDLSSARAITLGAGGGTIDTDGHASTISQGITGSGALTVASSTAGGMLTLTGANSYTGATTIDGGATLALSGAGSIAYSSDVIDDGTFDISGASGPVTVVNLEGSGAVNLGAQSLTVADATGIFGGSVTGTGGLAVTGGGETLTGDNVFSGGTTIDGGTLEIGDAANPGAMLQSDVTVDGSGVLRGHGTVAGNVVNDGTVSPGGTIGILKIAGNYSQNSGGTLNIEITPSTVAGIGYDQLRVTGTASLAGALAVQVDSGTYSVGSQYDILHAAGGVHGNFAKTSYNPAFAAYITPVVTYGADDVTLALTPTAAPGGMPDDLAFASGRIYAASTFVQDNALFSAVGAPVAQSGIAGAGDATDHGYWLRGMGDFGQANGFDMHEAGFVAGKGFDVSPDLVVGAAVSNLYTTTQGKDSSVEGKSFGLLGYAIQKIDRLTLSASAGVGHIGSNISRGLPTLAEAAKAASNGAYEAAEIQAQYNLLDSKGIFVMPYGSARYLHTGLGSAAERNAGMLDLRYDAMSTSLAELGAGVTAGLSIPVKYGMLTPWVQLGGSGTLGNPHIGDTEALGGFSAGETALAAPAASIEPAIGVTLAGVSSWRLSAIWGGQFGSATSTQNLALEGRYSW